MAGDGRRDVLADVETAAELANADRAERARKRALVRRGYDAISLAWLADARLTPIRERYVPEGNTGHSLILARAT